MLHYRHSETEVEAINLDCPNEFYPSNTNCAGPWHYHDFEWKEDKSLSVHCTGKKEKEYLHWPYPSLIDKWFMFSELIYYSLNFTAYQKIEVFRNPCTGLSMDFYIMETKKSSFIYNTLTSTLESRTRVQGCCKTLKQLVPIKNAKAIMNLMKFSIGSTIPKSPRYGSINFTAIDDRLPLLHLTSKLKELLMNR